MLFLRRLWWAALLLVGLSAGAVAGTIWQLRNDAIGAAVSESGNIATILSGQLSRLLQGIDAVLLDVLKRSAADQNLDTPAEVQAAFNAAANFRNR